VPTVPDIPSRKELAGLTVAASAVISPVILGFSRVRGDGPVSVLYSHASGIVEYVLAAADVPDALLPDSDGPRQGSVEAIGGTAQDALGWLLRFSGSKYVVSARVPECDVPTRFWAGSPETTPLTAEQLARFEAVSAAGAALLATPELPDETVERAHRLKLSSELLPALLHVLDVRQVFDRLSAIAKKALPHDLLLLRLFSEDLSTINIFARSDGGTVSARRFRCRIRLLSPRPGSSTSSTISPGIRSKRTGRRPRSARDPRFACLSGSTIGSSAESDSCRSSTGSTEAPTSRSAGGWRITWPSDCRTTTWPNAWRSRPVPTRSFAPVPRTSSCSKSSWARSSTRAIFPTCSVGSPASRGRSCRTTRLR
jgi:hypothetical protein